MVKWKIYYADRTTFTDEDGSPYDAPGLGVLCIAQSHPQVGREYVLRENHYWWDVKHQKWLGGDIVGMIDYQTFPGPQKVIHGRVVSNDNFKSVTSVMIKDTYLPPKSARLADEKII